MSLSSSSAISMLVESTRLYHTTHASMYGTPSAIDFDNFRVILAFPGDSDFDVSEEVLDFSPPASAA